MYITVRLLNGFQKPLLYKISDAPKYAHSLTGSIVTVPLQKRFEAALIIDTSQAVASSVAFTIRELPFSDIKQVDTRYLKFIQTLSHYYQTDFIHFARRIQQFVTQKTIKNNAPNELLPPTKKKEYTLTTEQDAIYQSCTQHITKPTFFPAVIHGVTGSGKTEIYKKLLVDCIALEKAALLLLPEVTLALQFEQLLRTQLPDTIAIVSFHSATSAKHKKILWHHIVEKKPCIIIGVHLPPLLPIANLGLIIVDEEHETGYQEKKHPKVNSKEAALLRAQQYNIPIILGSATPSVSTLYQVAQKKYHYFQLTKRFAGNFPTIRTVLLTQKNKKRRPHFWISNELLDAIQDRLAHNEQVILFLNRRGHSFFIQCTDCAHIIACKNCSVSLTVHEQNKLICHYCGYTRVEPTICPDCSADKKSFLKKGIGTQQLVTILQKLLPSARIARADMDSTAQKKKWHETITAFSNKEIDILIGTQTITKGYHFPGVTLVGIIWADLQLNIPLFNAQETTLQQLIQVAGRAGRQSQSSLVIVQSLQEYPLFSCIDERQYLTFYYHEMTQRKELGYPPYKRLVGIEMKHHQEEVVEHDAYALATQLRNTATVLQSDVQILGPAKPTVHKIKKTYMRILYIKSDSLSTSMQLLQKVSRARYRSSLFIVPNPIS